VTLNYKGLSHAHLSVVTLSRLFARAFICLFAYRFCFSLSSRLSAVGRAMLYTFIFICSMKTGPEGIVCANSLQ